MVRRSFMREVTGGFGVDGPFAGGGGPAKPMPATDADMDAGGKPGPAAGDSDH